MQDNTNFMNLGLQFASKVALLTSESFSSNNSANNPDAWFLLINGPTVMRAATALSSSYLDDRIMFKMSYIYDLMIICCTVACVVFGLVGLLTVLPIVMLIQGNTDDIFAVFLALPDTILADMQYACVAQIGKLEEIFDDPDAFSSMTGDINLLIYMPPKVCEGGEKKEGRAKDDYDNDTPSDGNLHPALAAGGLTSEKTTARDRSTMKAHSRRSELLRRLSVKNINLSMGGTLSGETLARQASQRASLSSNIPTTFTQYARALLGAWCCVGSLCSEKPGPVQAGRGALLPAPTPPSIPAHPRMLSNGAPHAVVASGSSIRSLLSSIHQAVSTRSIFAHADAAARTATTIVSSSASSSVTMKRRHLHHAFFKMHLKLIIRFAWPLCLILVFYAAVYGLVREELGSAWRAQPGCLQWCHAS